MLAAPLVRCTLVDSAVKGSTMYSIVVEDVSEIEKSFDEFEQLFEAAIRIGMLPVNSGAPPKKKLLQADIKLSERRRLWIAQLCQTLLSKHRTHKLVEEFFSLPQPMDEEDRILLGPSERKNARPTDFDFLQTIGRGNFGKVYLVRHRASQGIYAMKVLEKENVKKRNEVNHVMAERSVLVLNVHHPFLVSLNYCFQTKCKLYFVFEYLSGGELFWHIQREKHFSEDSARFYSAEVASALGHLHDNNIIYRDLKPENLLLDREGHVVLTDFGLCKEGIKVKDTAALFCGAPEYLPPEVVLKRPYDRAVDWWCLGCVLYEMLFGLPPFYSDDRNEMYESIVNKPLSFPSPAENGAREILDGLLQKDRLQRLGASLDFEEIRKHRFFVSIDWTKLQRRELVPPFVPHLENENDISHLDKQFTDQKLNEDYGEGRSISVFRTNFRDPVRL